MREARAGLVHRLHIGILFQDLFAAFAFVELADHLGQQPQVKKHRGGHVDLGIKNDFEMVVLKARIEFRLSPIAARAIGRRPHAADDPRKFFDLLKCLLQEARRTQFGFRQFRDAPHPQFERHANAHQVVREIRAQPIEAGARPPQHREDESAAENASTVSTTA
ncbi:MAG: hypothetical protein IPP88_18745 [Betaproteobacteria bacterium]|nr:hypothetical protein [Betaproteobacteria bacterium]